MSAAETISPQFLAELSERLFVISVGGRWMAPLGDRPLPVPAAPGAHLACAGEGDLARALRLLAPGPVDAGAMAAAYLAQAGVLRGLRRLEGAADPVAPPEAMALPGTGPFVLLSAAAMPLSRIAGLLIAGAAQGMLWKPAPGAAASAHLLMEALAPVAGARLAMLHGDHATGALLAGQGAVLWASDAAPPEGLAVRLRVPARYPHRP
ncbi:MAG: hypothetical protein ACK4GT_11930 [Pararhodobacter sp.]